MQVITWLSFAFGIFASLAAVAGAIVHYHDVSRRHEQHNAIAETVARHLHLTGATDHAKIAETVVEQFNDSSLTGTDYDRTR